jgi:hypothetical protein
MKKLNALKVGDRVNRFLLNLPPMPLFIIKVTDDRVFCGICPEAKSEDTLSNPVWEFCRATGNKIDDDLGLRPGRTISHIEPAA